MNTQPYWLVYTHWPSGTALGATAGAGGISAGGGGGSAVGAADGGGAGGESCASAGRANTSAQHAQAAMTGVSRPDMTQLLSVRSTAAAARLCPLGRDLKRVEAPAAVVAMRDLSHHS